MNLTNRPVYTKGQKPHKATTRQATDDSPLGQLIAQANGIPEREYLDWLRTQPSAYSGLFSWDGGTPFCEPAHFRTAKNSGVGCKPAFLAIPLRHEEHAQQHQVGQFNFRPREWWIDQCQNHLKAWLDVRAGCVIATPRL